MQYQSKPAMTSRLFIAIPLNTSMQQLAMRPSGMEGDTKGIRFTPPSNLHITQFFIGDVQNELLQEIVRTAEGVCTLVSPYRITAADFCYVPARHPAMIWLRFLKDDGFAGAYRLFTQALSPLLPEAVRFTDPVPHVTIARLQRSFRKEQFDLPEFSVKPEQDVYALELWETIRTGYGVRYRSLIRWELQGEKGDEVRDPERQPLP